MKTLNIHNNSLKAHKAKKKVVLIASLMTGANLINQKQKCMYFKKMSPQEEQSWRLLIVIYLVLFVFMPGSWCILDLERPCQARWFTSTISWTAYLEYIADHDFGNGVLVIRCQNINAEIRAEQSSPHWYPFQKTHLSQGTLHSDPCTGFQNRLTDHHDTMKHSERFHLMEMTVAIGNCTVLQGLCLHWCVFFCVWTISHSESMHKYTLIGGEWHCWGQKRWHCLHGSRLIN